MKLLNSILQFLRASNFMAAKSVARKEKMYCKYSFLKNGKKVRGQLLKEWLTISNRWSTQFDDVQQNENRAESANTSWFLEKSTFQKLNENIYNEKFVNLDNSIVIKTIYNNCSHNFASEHNILYGSKTKTLLVTDYFVAAKNEMSKYNILQRERKIWWMRFSFNPSRYQFAPHELRSEEEECDIVDKSKSVIITANFPFGLVDMEYIYLVPLYQLDYFNKSFHEYPHKISLLRSVIDLDLTASALILDASVYKTVNQNYTLMLNRRLAPYQVLLANMHQGNKDVDELTLHLQHIISRSGLRSYDNFLRTNNLTELEEKVINFDGLGIPYTLLVDDESIRSGLIKMRSRDTTVFETIHISDIPNYLLKIFKH